MSKEKTVPSVELRKSSQMTNRWAPESVAFQSCQNFAEYFTFRWIHLFHSHREPGVLPFGTCAFGLVFIGFVPYFHSFLYTGTEESWLQSGSESGVWCESKQIFPFFRGREESKNSLGRLIDQPANWSSALGRTFSAHICINKASAGPGESFLSVKEDLCSLFDLQSRLGKRILRYNLYSIFSLHERHSEKFPSWV